ncbi:hypothetical protein Drorol1_Dr00001620 [Drosera rotundifolia]
MSKNKLIPIILVAFLFYSLAAYGSASCCSCQFLKQKNQTFKQITDQFYKFDEQSNSWVEVKLPYDLVTCVNGNCTKVGSILPAEERHPRQQAENIEDRRDSLKAVQDEDGKAKENYEMLLPLRKRVSLTKISEASIWVTGESGSIYERFWNGVQWVIVPHDLPESAGHAISIFPVNQTLFALSATGHLYQLRLADNSQPVWVDFLAPIGHPTTPEAAESSSGKMKSGVVSHDRLRIYFCTMSGSLLELAETEPQRWIDHGHPPGADVTAIADAASIKSEVVFTISSAGELYEHDRNSRPQWKKHVWREESAQVSALAPTKGCSLQGIIGTGSVSLFVISKNGALVERRLHQRKWKWIEHGNPEGYLLTSITPLFPDDRNEKLHALLLTTATGSIFEFQMSTRTGCAKEQQTSEIWVNHRHPLHTAVARGISGLPFQAGRTFFPLDDGRLAELHIQGLGGENSGPAQQVSSRRKTSLKYEWSKLDAPETEGWNAEYCTESRGPANCIAGTKEEATGTGTTWQSTRKKKGAAESYLTPDDSSSDEGRSPEKYILSSKGMESISRMRVMHKGRSLFLVTNSGHTFEYLYNDEIWLWLQHQHPLPMKGAIGSYNGSLFLADGNGCLLTRERIGTELGWINCTAMRKGKQIADGPPWDREPNTPRRAKLEDTLFFVSRSGRLLQFTVSQRKFKWKDCKRPPNTKISSIIDQEGLRENILFVAGRNGRLYQYNRLTGLWHEHYQSRHLVLSISTGTAMRPSASSLKGSLFMISEEGGLVEYHWNTLDGWTWVEHGTPHAGVMFLGAPGPSFEGNQIFLIGTDGNIYLRYYDVVEWKWKNYGYPNPECIPIDQKRQAGSEDEKRYMCVDTTSTVIPNNIDNCKQHDRTQNCDPKVASTRPIRFADDSVIFELRDKRLAEMRQTGDFTWVWSRIIVAPASMCKGSYWTALAS